MATANKNKSTAPKPKAAPKPAEPVEQPEVVAEPFAIVQNPDGTTTGDGKSLATLPADAPVVPDDKKLAPEVPEPAEGEQTVPAGDVGATTGEPEALPADPDTEADPNGSEPAADDVTEVEELPENAPLPAYRPMVTGKKFLGYTARRRAARG